MDPTCTTCRGRLPATTDRYLCEACEYRMHTWLRDIPRHLPFMRAMLRPDTGPAQRGGSGRAHSPLPVRLEVLDFLGPGHAVPLEDPHGDQCAGIPISATLYGWARYLASEYPSVYRDRQHDTIRIDRCDGARAHARPGGGGSITAWSAWLDAYLPYAVTRPWADDMYHQLEDLMDRIRRITHTTPRRTAKDAPCPSCSAFALVEREDELHISCLVCPVRLTPEQYTEHRDQVMPDLVRLALLMEATREGDRRKAAA